MNLSGTLLITNCILTSTRVPSVSSSPWLPVIPVIPVELAELPMPINIRAGVLPIITL
jgi:hypothetical protein